MTRRLIAATVVLFVACGPPQNQIAAGAQAAQASQLPTGTLGQLLAPIALYPVLATTQQVSVAGLGWQAIAAAPTSAECSLTWIGREDEIETFLTSAKVLKIEDVPIGVTKPQRATLEPGPVARFTWKPINPGYRRGFMESYRAEIAAYKLDRMLDLHMVPPIVEREYNGRNGAAVMWIENTRGWNLKEPPQGPQPTWSLQLTRMKIVRSADRQH
jgi:hypothetical protein